VRRCRFAIIPLKATPSKASGITLMGAALAEGRPLI